MIRSSFLLLLALVSQAEDTAAFPAEAGYRWTYRSSSRLGNVILRTEKEWKGADGWAFVFETSAEGARTTRETLLRTPRGVFANADGEGPPLIKFPPENEGTEQVEVPAGTFRCWKVRQHRWLPLGSKSRTRWYAKGIGLVKELLFDEIEGGAREDLYELEKFEKDPAKK